MPVTGSSILAMQEIDIIDETFDRDRTSTYELSIQVSLNGFSYAVKDTIRNTFIALFNTGWQGFSISSVDFRNFIGKLTEAKPWLKGEFKKVIVAFNLPYFTIVPNEFFEPSKSKLLLEQVHSTPDGFELGFTELPNLSLVIIYAAPHEFINEWKSLHGGSLFTHSLLSFIQVPYSYTAKPFLQVDIDQQHLAIILHNNGQLLAANSYLCKSTTDVVYYTNALARSVIDNTYNLQLNLTGDGELMAGLPEEIVKYFNSVTHQANFYKPVFFSYRLLRYRTEYFRLFNLGVTCE